VPSSRMCGGGEDGNARIIEPQVPPFCPPPMGVADAPSPPSPTLPTGGPRSPPALSCPKVCEGRPGNTMGNRGSSGRKARPGPIWTPKRGFSRSRGSQSGRPPSAPASPARSPARRLEHSRRMMPGIVQQRLLQLRQGAGDHHGLQEVRDEQGDRLFLHHLQDGGQQVQDILREEPEMSSKPKEKIINRKERGPQMAYLVNRQDGSSLPTPAPQKTWSLLSPARPKKERDEVQEDEAEIMRKTIQEEEKKNQEKYSYSETKNCTEIPSGDHAYLGSGGVEEWSLAWRQPLDVPHLRHHHHLRELYWMFQRSFHHL
jgi:hypothetical protein